MALRNQPYLPLYVQDFLTDEKLIECSAEATGVYIRLMCIMHKNDKYGTILLKQKDKQTESMCLNFALKLSKQMPYPVEVIEKSLNELIEEGVLVLNDCNLLQKRMIKDNDISEKRSLAGKIGGGNPNFVSKFVKTKRQTNTENENENENINKIKKIKYGEYNHVLLTEKEYSCLVRDFGEKKTKYLIKMLDEGIELKGYKYKNHNLAVRKWEKNTEKERNVPRGRIVPLVNETLEKMKKWENEK